MRRFWILSILSGVLLAFTYPPYNLEFLVWLGFIPLFLLTFSLKNDEIRKNFYAGFTAGFIYFLITMKWFWSIYPLTWVGVESKFISFVLVGLIWMISALGMALWWGISLAIGKKLITNNNSEKLPSISSILLIVPATFILTEYLRSWFFGLLWIGPGTLWGPHWTIGNLAYSFHNNPLILKLSSFVGIYGITFIIMLVNFFIFFFIFRSFNGSKIIKEKIIGIVLIIFSLSYLPKLIKFVSDSGSYRSVPVAIIQTQIPSETNYPADKQLDDFKAQIVLLKEAARLNPKPEVVVFPEWTNFFRSLSIFLNPGEAKNFFENIFPEPTLIIDNSRVINESGEFKSRVIYLDSKTGVLGFYDKKFLTPGGEFLPYHLKFIIDLFSKNKTSIFSNTREFSKGNSDPLIVETKNIRTGSLVCSGILSPSLYRELSSLNPDFLITMASTGIFKGAEDLLQQNLATIKFRAAENNKYIILAANYGYSYVVSNTGKLEKITPNKNWQLFTVEVVPQKEQTWYNKFGDIPLLILIFSTILISSFATKRRSFRIHG